MHRVLFGLPLAGLLLLLIPKPANAQQAGSFEQLQVLVKAGDKISVTTATSARPITANVIGLSESVLKVKTKGKEESFKPADVLEIRMKRPDSLRNGAIWGASLAAGFFALAVGATCSEGYCSQGDVAPLIFSGVSIAGIGAGMGIGIDALIEHRQTIYRPVRRLSSGFQVSPIISGSRKGALVSLRF